MGRKLKPYKQTKEFKNKKKHFCGKCGKEVKSKMYRSQKDFIYMHEVCFFNS